MKALGEIGPLVYSQAEKCKMCYTCVRECPAKAIRIINGQADVIQDRCIGCGNCIKVCSQGAKKFRSATTNVKELLESDEEVLALVAPSFPAEYMDRMNDHKQFVGMLYELGFDKVYEVGFGADLVARKYEELFNSDDPKRYITSDCPAIVNYVEKYFPDLTDNLAKIVSPMVATIRVVKEIHGENVKTVFIGPCVAKKDESQELDYGLTFTECNSLFQEFNISHKKVKLKSFSPPRAGKGAIFPVSRGLIQSIDLDDNIHKGNIVVAEGRVNFQEALREFDDGVLCNDHLELLCCEGCIVGPGMTNRSNRYAKRTFISDYVRKRISESDPKIWEREMKKWEHIELSREFSPNDQRIQNPSDKTIDEILKAMGKESESDHLDCGACGYDTCVDHAIAIKKGFAENEMCLPYTIEKLHNSVKDLAVTNDKLASVQQALNQSEKLAHMGQLSAGIAHELNNPLGVVMMYSNILLDETDADNPLREDLQLIVDQAERCKKIVGGLLNFARKNQLQRSHVNVIKLIEKSATSVVVPKNIEIELSNNINNPIANIDREQMMQVLTNLNKNAIEAMPNGGKLKLSVEYKDKNILFIISDSGQGIAKEDMGKLFTPFFTTKEIGKGTGLGLATAYGVVKMHQGKISVESNTDPEQGQTGTTFTIEIPPFE